MALYHFASCLAVLLGSTFVCAKNGNGSPRVRKEWRTLTHHMKQKVADAMWVMKSTLSAEGKHLYGDDFENYDDIIVRHACAVVDPRCDQGHAGPAFMTFHRAVLIEFENALLAIDPDIGAMPYWDVTLDSENGGIYYQQDPEWIFSSSHFGSYNGDPNQNFQVMDGLFAEWPIIEYSEDRFAHLDTQCVNEGWFTGTTTTTCTRCCAEEGACECTPDDSFPTFLRNHDDCTGIVTRSAAQEDENHVGGYYDIQFTQKDFDKCIDGASIQNWMDWNWCIDVSNNDCFSRFGDVEAMKAALIPQVLNSKGNQEAKDATVAALEAMTNECRIEGHYKNAAGATKSVRAHHGDAHFRLEETWKTLPPPPMTLSFGPIMLISIAKTCTGSAIQKN